MMNEFKVRVFDEDMEGIKRLVEKLNQNNEYEQEWTVDDVIHLAFDNGLRQLIKREKIKTTKANIRK